jgi:hypothetical protein
MPIIYGVDTEKEITPIEVRDAILECFYQAHCMNAELGKDELATREYCASLIRKFFTDVGGNFENPTKETLLLVIDNLAKFSQNFRDPQTIEGHHKEIMTLINKL